MNYIHSSYNLVELIGKTASLQNYYLTMESTSLSIIPFLSLRLRPKMSVEVLMKSYRHVILRKNSIRSCSFL